MGNLYQFILQSLCMIGIKDFKQVLCHHPREQLTGQKELKI